MSTTTPRLQCRGCGQIDPERNAETAYCPPCQDIYTEVMAAHLARVDRQFVATRLAPIQSGSNERHRRRVGVGGGYTNDYADWSEADWMDAVNPHEGDR